MSASRAQPVRLSLNALLAQRAAPRWMRRSLADAVVTAVQAHPPRLWTKYMTWALVVTTEPPYQRKTKRKGDPMSGKIIEETASETAAHEAAKAAATNGTVTPEQVERVERRAARTHHAAAQRERWLESSGFGLAIERAEALLADLPRALEEYHRAQATLGDLATFHALAQEALEDRVLQRYARRAEDLARTIAAPPMLVENASALRELIARVRSADLDHVNGPVRNSNLATAWRRRFSELLTPLPQLGHTAWCAQQVKAFIIEARAAREGRV